MATSIIRLTSYFEAAPRRDLLPPSVELGDVYLPRKISPPSGGLTAFFGNIQAARRLGSVMKAAEARALTAWPVIIELRARPISSKRLNTEDIGGRDIVNMDVISKQAEAYVQTQWDRFTEEDGSGTEDTFRYYDRFVTRFPQRLERLVLETPVFRGVGGVIYNIADENDDLWQYATIFNPGLITAVTTLAGPITVTLPARLRRSR